MDNLTPWEVLLLLGGMVMAVAGIVNTLGSAVEKVAKAVKAAKAPEESQNERLKKVEADIKEIKGKLDKDKERLDDSAKANHVTQEAILALLEHGLHGNNVQQMTTAKNNLEKYLINH